MNNHINVVLVDKKDKILGFKERFATHRIPVPLHRAISIVILSGDNKRILITKRSFQKPTWGGIWSNAVCSHPFSGETYEKAAERRLKEELGIKTPLKKCFQFVYQAEMDNKIWGENEYDAVFVGSYDGSIMPDPDEVAGYEWIETRDLNKDIIKNPNKYTPWFKMILGRLTDV